jgi:hypothetical protein
VRKIQLAVSAICGILTLSTSSALAASYQGFCGGTACTITVTPNEIISPYGSIPAGRVTNWGGGGNSEARVGVGVATTIIFGPLGLLGFLAKKHDYNFLVNGFDQEGKKVMMNIQFKKEKPAKDFMNELQMVTQLGSGQTRTATEIMTAEASGSSGLSATTLQDSFEKEKNSINATPGPLQNTSTGLNKDSKQNSSNCWSAYLQKNPAMAEWAKKNPSQAAQNKTRFEDC